MKKSQIGALTLLLLSWSAPIHAQEHRHGNIIVTRTRWQVVFGRLEEQWLKAIQNKDEAALNGLLSDDFALWMSAPPGSPSPRSDWQKAAFSRKLQSYGMRQLAVRAVSADVSVASFVLTETFDQAGTAKTEQYFVVDVWTKTGEGDNWHCTDRYLSRVGVLSHPVGARPSITPDGKN